MAEVDFNQMNGLEVLVYLLANEPALWGIIGLGVIAFIGSMIFDKWNIRANEHGPVAYCYYGNFGTKPRGTLNKEDYVSIWINKPKTRRELDKKVFWLKSLPDGFKDVVAF